LVQQIKNKNMETKKTKFHSAFNKQLIQCVPLDKNYFGPLNEAQFNSLKKQKDSIIAEAIKNMSLKEFNIRKIAKDADYKVGDKIIFYLTIGEDKNMIIGSFPERKMRLMEKKYKLHSQQVSEIIPRLTPRITK